MLPHLLRQYCSARPLASITASAILVLGLCSCQTAGTDDITGSLGEKTEASRAADPRRDLEVYRDRFRANPKDADAAIQYGKALRATGQRAQAVAVLEEATIAHPDNKALLAGYGRALAAVLRKRVEDSARRAFSAVQSRPVLHAFERSAQGGGDPAPRQ